MNVQCEPSKVKQTKPRAYIVRFVFGGLITALSGLCWPISRSKGRGNSYASRSSPAT